MRAAEGTAAETASEATPEATSEIASESTPENASEGGAARPAAKAHRGLAQPVEAMLATKSLRAPRGEQPPQTRANGAAAVRGWVDARSSEFAVVAQRRDVDGAAVDRALEIVRNFIVERRLVLFGGLAIDYALRRVGSSIYPDDQRPDFDFMSPRSVEDAYELADILFREGFSGVGAVRGIHVQTMRVRANHTWVADIGYAAAEVFDAIPTFEHAGMRVVHPDYQRMDMHLAFCFPFNGPPREDVFHRWRKDLRRFNEISKHYPVAPAAVPAGALVEAHSSGAHEVSAVFAAAVSADLESAELPRAALHGFAAYAALRESLEVLAERLGESLGEHLQGAEPPPRLHVSVGEDGRTVRAALPVGSEIVVASPWPEELVAGMAEVRRYYPYMDVYPESARAPGLAVVSTAGRLLAASIIRLGGRRVLIVTPQYLLLWLLFEAHRAAAPSREVYTAYYGHTMAVLRAAESIYAARVASVPEGAAAGMASFNQSPFAPTTLTIGDTNHDAAYIIRIAGYSQKLRDEPPPALGLPAGVATILEGLPANYYPDKKRAPPPFDYGASELFRRAGGLKGGNGGLKGGNGGT